MWFKSGEEKIIVKETMDKFYQNRVDVLMTQVEGLQKDIKRLEWISNNPKKYQLGEVVDGCTVFEINCLDFEFKIFKKCDNYSWEYKGISKSGKTILLK
jgi:hypothetical protein